MVRITDTIEWRVPDGGLGQMSTRESTGGKYRSRSEHVWGGGGRVALP